MKGNDGTGNHKGRDSWQTPQEMWNKLNEQYGFTFDCCASVDNRKTHGYSNDFKKVDFRYVSNACWMNPPFSKAYEMFEHFFKVINNGVAIYRCDNIETKVWQDQILKNCDWIFIFNKRINYEGQESKGVRFPSALIGIGVDHPKLTNGYLLIPKKLPNNLEKENDE